MASSVEQQLLYDDKNFDAYELQLLASCVNTKKTNIKFLHKDDDVLPVDPIRQFYNDHTAAIDAVVNADPDYTVPTAEELLEKPSHHGQKFLRYLDTNNIRTVTQRRDLRKS